ncbi:MAG: cell division protein FtsH [Candidatus Liptonbacteria bacterium RIFCSPLOWO2_01_FULL_56_20]|uniref:ATP-dependent zinc metalloprotease FtsH n=1 Tax=Candidatus Liptonbacteria bacterium RIFCSPLOWO2_01_FULL_56_20 TaxID=1798652 RepID=A0A1G2CIS7_9BACT|nr:MAG: ATP-dependent zinc metalloprotease FtsH [Parcubacteria group bacterium GW2011_GWB1_56_8]OGY97808.1 MAG: cell division protein FtsH [Candidatus Liptonbacteria bacterium RIFCSPHIGHO2_01_FULL_56_18b]OGZ01147.1 MAG: cell division protein FtsH [Candidatus Liptonbacteria bacterium RIFCSPLOWO2_01_FULL_56_20]
MTNFSKNLLWTILALIAISLVFSLFAETGKAPEKLSLNQLAEKINAGEVINIKVSGEDLDVTLKDNVKAAAQKETEASLTETLKNFGVDPAALQKVGVSVQNQSGLAFWASILIPTLLPLLVIGFFFWMMFRQARVGVNQAFNFGRSNIRLSTFGKERVTFSDVAGLKEAKEELVEIVDFLKNPKKFLDLGARIPRGVLLVGLPGTGKTLLARAAAGESNVPFFHISASEFVEMFVGVGASRIRDAFLTARKAAPAILFIDEIDAVGRQRGAGLGGGNDEREQALNQILVELDGFDRDTRVIVLSATNRPDILDPALLRPGRFDRRVILDLPDINDREAILKIHAKGKALNHQIDLRKIAIRTPGFSGADLANLMNEAAILAARRNKKTIAQDELYESVEKVLLGPERRTRAISVHEKEITAYHEGGHALVAATLKGADPIHKVSIISRGFAGGYTMKLPIEDQHIRTKTQFVNDLAIMMGGYASEKLTFSDVSTGASNDLKEASDLARRLVTRYGMSESLGPVTFGKTEELIFLGREIATEKNYSEKIAAKIDDEVRNFIEHAYAVAEKILREHKKALEKIAKTLIEKETLEQDDFYALLKPFRIKLVAV